MDLAVCRRCQLAGGGGLVGESLVVSSPEVWMTWINDGELVEMGGRWCFRERENVVVVVLEGGSDSGGGKKTIIFSCVLHMI
ncbi:hypothetical protein HanRHA438_Chr05g0206871 [Helianthus annuus]|uniref:Uncharacterized protein n=1 Tax=Helianthus annuus TaxID=4232 RepID=A0A9K3NLA4_HELAN|nr:hypothetical protein HanXRQr2_Chr05g0197351 [Helianthus annuus]KAJ0583379.1 hypothetical protein HanHA89_Chr05g0175871 [Helianthus annuus]KAJ0638803.1 hypothetical protein HanHA300_Chr00c0042g0694461 [Helianthus annuus]KAJ0746113.1 hypothetical protein HanOQP8_Chr05g0173791 [Helianthus annuus]KAJ0749119.1 hypothetical protein HanLR1_Chr05g0166081 [Helianthus annuus]